MTLPVVQNLRVTSTGPGGITIAWDAIDRSIYGPPPENYAPYTSVTDPFEYSIWRKLASSSTWPTSRTFKTNGSTTTFTDTTAVAGTAYDYRVSYTFGPDAEWVEIVGKGSNYLDVNRFSDRRHAHVAGTPIDLDVASAWNRPGGAFSTARNGRTVNDPGIAQGFKNRDADWRPTNGAHAVFRGGYIGHPYYQTQASPVYGGGYDAVWPVGTFDLDSRTRGYSFTDTYDGSELWLQFRMKADASRFLPDMPAAKFWYVQTCNRTSACQVYLTCKPSTNGNKPTLEMDGQAEIPGQWLMPLTDGGQQWAMPADTWCTYMLHLIPGRMLVAEGTIEFFVAYPGDTSWRTLYSSNVVPFPYSWDQTGNDAESTSRTNPPGYNCFNPRNYPNHYEGSSSSGASPRSHAIYFSQIIWSTREIAFPRNP